MPATILPVRDKEEEEVTIQPVEWEEEEVTIDPVGEEVTIQPVPDSGEVIVVEKKKKPWPTWALVLLVLGIFLLIGAMFFGGMAFVNYKSYQFP